MKQKFDTLQEALDSVHIPPKVRARGLRELLRDRDETQLKLNMLLNAIKHICTHAKLSIDEEYCEDSWDHQQWTEHIIHCADCNLYLAKIYEDNGFSVKGR